MLPWHNVQTESKLQSAFQQPLKKRQEKKRKRGTSNMNYNNTLSNSDVIKTIQREISIC